MNIPEYLKARKKLRCTYQQPKRNANYHQEIGKILEKTGEREKMEVDKEELITPAAEELDFIF